MQIELSRSSVSCFFHSLSSCSGDQLSFERSVILSFIVSLSFQYRRCKRPPPQPPSSSSSNPAYLSLLLQDSSLAALSSFTSPATQSPPHLILNPSSTPPSVSRLCGWYPIPVVCLSTPSSTLSHYSGVSSLKTLHISLSLKSVK